MLVHCLANSGEDATFDAGKIYTRCVALEGRIDGEQIRASDAGNHLSRLVCLIRAWARPWEIFDDCNETNNDECNVGGNLILGLENELSLGFLLKICILPLSLYVHQNGCSFFSPNFTSNSRKI